MSATTTKVRRSLYTAEATVTGGRQGHGRSSDGRLDVDLSVPEELGGEGGPGTNPEQLFAVGYAACFQSALISIAGREHLDAGNSTITSRVGLGPIGEDRMGLAVELTVDLPSIPDRARAEDLVASAHKLCPYSNAIRDNVEVTLTVK